MIEIAIALVVGGVAGYYIKTYWTALTAEETKVVNAFSGELAKVIGNHTTATVAKITTP